MLKIYNTMTRKKELFEPIEPGKIGMYVCGVTVYDYCHIGHARVTVAFDVITRYLRASGFDVKYVRNITDVDDKIFNRARENNEPFDQLTGRFIEAMHEDERRLGVLPPTLEPRATHHMGNIVDLVSKLVEKGAAYCAENGDVYFTVEKFADYGKLTNRKTEDLLVGARVEVGEFKRNPLDFVLWKAAKAGEASWDSPWGKGRPGWHIECSAMSTQCLSETFDIHGGGPDLPFPHHENEIAQSEAATGQKYVNYWMHAGAVRVNQEKMSKSLGNFFTIREVLERYHAEEIRYFLISSHYRSPINYSEESLQTARTNLLRFYIALRDVPALSDGDQVSQQENEEVCTAFRVRFNEAMDDDFNTPEALAVMYDIVREMNKVRGASPGLAYRLSQQLLELGGVLGVLQESPAQYVQYGGAATDDEGEFASKVEALIEKRLAARLAKDWGAADATRDQIAGMGVELEDRPDGKTIWRRV